MVNSWRAVHCPGCRAGERGLNLIFYKFIFSFMVRLSIGCFSFVCLFPPGARGWPCSRNLALARLPVSCSTEPWPRCMIVIFKIDETQNWLTVCVATLGLDVGKKLEESSDQRLDEQRSRLTNEGRGESLPAGELEKTFLVTAWIFHIQLSRFLDNLPCLASGAATSTRSMRRARRRVARRRRSSGPSWWRSSWTGAEDGGWSELSRWVAQEELGHHLKIRDGWRHQIGWIFGKVPNGPSLIFKKSCCNFFRKSPV